MDKLGRKTHALARWVVVALCAAVVSTSMGLAADARSYDPDKIDPLLAQQVTADPDGEFSVIVRTQATRSSRGAERTARARAAVRQQGGTSKFSLGIIGGEAARVTGRAAMALTRDRDVEYVFRDAPITASFDPLVDAAKATNPVVTLTYASYAWSYFNVCGRGVTVAVVDSGVHAHADLGRRIVAAADFTQDPAVFSTTAQGDPGGHGTHVAGLVAGDGASSAGVYTGVAPCASIVDVRVLDAFGRSTTSTVLRGLQWVLANRATYGIRIVNLSFGAQVSGSYRRDPLSVAAEALVFAGLTVVAAAGNGGPTSESIVAPANDPFVLSVGAFDDAGTTKPSDDTIATFSGRGPSKFDRLSKPDVVAPGRKVISLLSPGSTLAAQYPDRLVSATGAATPQYFRLSGTSMAAPVVSGLIALLLEKEPTLTPFQVRYRMKAGVKRLNKIAPFDAGAGLATAAPLWLTDYGTQIVASPLADAFAEDLYSSFYGQPIQWRSNGYNGGVDSLGQEWPEITWDNIAWDSISWENIAWERFSWENIAWENIAWENLGGGSDGQSLLTNVTNLRWQLVD